jgi:aldehyde dehydrogenase (NAD+)
MKSINQIYINGEFVKPHGTETFDLISSTTNQKIGEVQLGDEYDTKAAIAAAKDALKTFSKTTKAERIVYLEKMQAAVRKRESTFKNQPLIVSENYFRHILCHANWFYAKAGYS